MGRSFLLVNRHPLRVIRFTIFSVHPTHLDWNREAVFVEWGEIPFVRPPVPPWALEALSKPGEPSERPGELSESLLRALSKGSPGLSEGPPGLSEDFEGPGGTNGRTEFLPILWDFIPYRGRCPKSETSCKVLDQRRVLCYYYE